MKIHWYWLKILSRKLIPLPYDGILITIILTVILINFIGEVCSTERLNSNYVRNILANGDAVNDSIIYNSSNINFDNDKFENNKSQSRSRNRNRNLNDNNDNNNNNNYNGEKILSRQRRYLVFPEGSSFQLVYDGIIPVPDFPNYLILGITVALAWELPSKPPSEIIENFRDKLNSGTFGLTRNDSIQNIEYIDTKPKPIANIQKYSDTKISNFNQKQSPYYTNPYRKPTNYYTSSSASDWKLNRFHPPMNYNYNKSNKYLNKYESKYSQNAQSSIDYEYNRKYANYSKWNRNDDINYNSNAFIRKPSSNWNEKTPWTKIIDKVDETIRQNRKKTFLNLQQKPTKLKSSNQRYQQRKHRIYPVFGKRSIPDSELPYHETQRDTIQTDIDKIHLRYHRSSRHDLYSKIEKYLQTGGKNGKECVLKALCETGKKSNEVEPGSFVGEIMRAIFTLPESRDPVINSQHKLYDAAQMHNGDCTERYPLCPDSIWSADFIY